MRKIIISIPTIKYIISGGKINRRDKKEGHLGGVLYI